MSYNELLWAWEKFLIAETEGGADVEIKNSNEICKAFGANGTLYSGTCVWVLQNYLVPAERTGWTGRVRKETIKVKILSWVD